MSQFIPARTVLLLSLAFQTVTVATLQAQALPGDLREVMVHQFHFDDGDLAALQKGQPVARIIPGRQPDDIRLAGAVLIGTTSVKFIDAYKDIVHFETGKEVTRTRKFSDPPMESDLKDFHAPDLNKKDVMACKPGKCVYKIPLYAMHDLQQKVNWSAPDAKEQADVIVRQLSIDYLRRYRRDGNAALATYYDTPKPFSVAQGLKELTESFTVVKEKAPDFLRYLEEYPKARPEKTEEFFYWQEAAFGLKPLVRSSHVVIQELPRPEGSHYLIASQMLFASHYFRAAIEFKYVYPVKTSDGKTAVYFATYQHSYVDGLTGFSGAILRRIVPGRSQASLVENLRLAKNSIESRTN